MGYQCQLIGLFVPLLVLSVPPPRVQAAQQAPVETVTFDARYMSTQVVHQVDPDFPWTRTSPQDAAPWCSFTVVIGVDGTVRTVGPEKWVPGNCAEPYFSSAKRALRLWTWKPQFRDGVPVQVSFYVTVKFDSTSFSPVSIVDTDQISAVSIVLKSGSIIHADTVAQEDKTVSYTIGEDSYQIPADLVEKILKPEAPAPKPAKEGTVSEGAKLVGFESLAEIQRQCGDPARFMAGHPEFAAYGANTCPAFSLKMDEAYEEKVEEAVRSESLLCARYEAPAKDLQISPDPDLAGPLENYQKRRAEIREVGQAADGKLNNALIFAIGSSYSDLEQERQDLTQRFYNLNPRDPQAATIQARLQTISQLQQRFLYPLTANAADTPTVRAARLEDIRTQLDWTRLNVACTGSSENRVK